jgi:hypothetical protein
MAELTLTTGQTFDEGVASTLDILSATYTPYLNKYRYMVGSMGSREIWYNEILSKNEVTLASAYTAADGQMTLNVATNANDFKITPNITYIETTDGSLVFPITAYNTGTGVATLGTLAFGSDANVASGTTLRLTKYGTYGEDFGSSGGDEFQLSKTDINYPTFIYHRLQSADGNEENKWDTVGMNEAQIAHIEKKFYVQNLKQLEGGLFYSVKAAGSGAATRQGNTITSGLDSKAAGLNTFISANGGRTPDNGSVTPVSEKDIIKDVEFMRDTGALTDLMSFDRNEGQLGEVDMYVSEATLGDINKFIRLERDEKALSAQANGVFGSWGTRLIANGAYVNVKVSSGVKDNDYFMMAANADIKHKFIYFFDKVNIGKTGHNTKCMYVTGYTTCPANSNAMVHRKNIARLVA